MPLQITFYHQINSLQTLFLCNYTIFRTLLNHTMVTLAPLEGPGNVLFYGCRTFSLLKYSLLCNRGLQCCQSLCQYMSPDFLLFFHGQCRIAKRMRNSDSRNNTVSSYCQRNRNYSCNMNYWDSCSFNFFYHRCTATCTGTSGRGQNDRIYPVIPQLLCELCSESLGVSYGCTVSNCGIEISVQAADFSFFFKFS